MANKTSKTDPLAYTLFTAEVVEYARIKVAHDAANAVPVACVCAFCGVSIPDQGGLCEAVACNDKADFAMDAYYEGA